MLCCLSAVECVRLRPREVLSFLDPWHCVEPKFLSACGCFTERSTAGHSTILVSKIAVGTGWVRPGILSTCSVHMHDAAGARPSEQMQNWGRALVLPTEKQSAYILHFSMDWQRPSQRLMRQINHQDSILWNFKGADTHRRPIEVCAKHLGVEGGAHEDEFERWPPPEQLFEQNQQEIGVQIALVHLVDCSKCITECSSDILESKVDASKLEQDEQEIGVRVALVHLVDCREYVCSSRAGQKFNSTGKSY